MALSDNPIIALVAGEASGDTLGEGLIKSLKQHYPTAKFVGIGGPKMMAQGLDSWYPMEKLSLMGFFEVLKHLPELLKLRKSLIQRLLNLKPDVFIGIDAPDFNLKLERALKEQGIKVVHYVGPTVWAWREKRLEKIKLSVDGVLVLFPFEPPYYEKYQIPVKFVGHPLANEVTAIPQREVASKVLKLDEKQLVVGILPGSRMSEISKMTNVYIQAAIKLKDTYSNVHFVIPCIHQKARKFIEHCIESTQENIQENTQHKDLFTLVDGQAQLVMEASHYLIVTSGTATLEAALMKRPMIIAIKVHWLSYWLMKRMSTTQWVGLPNILAKKSLVPELIQDEATPDRVFLELSNLISNKSVQQKQLMAFDEQYKSLKKNASELAADAVVAWAELK